MRIYETISKVLFGSLLALLCLNMTMSEEENVFLTRSGRIYFKSDAPLELIEASSNQLGGAIDLRKRTFAFTVEMNSFEGFNNPLQRIHFNENYMESRAYRRSTFVGKIIEKTDLSKPGEYIIRAKGKLTIHGRTRERIIKSKVRVTKDQLIIHSYFTVLLEEHDITIPKIVHQKIAQEIQVFVDAVLNKTN